MDVLDIARWQFGITTVYHFLFVPITIGLTAIVAGYETVWVRTRKEHYLRLAKFFGKLLLINFAMGIVTGIVQEFQFGMAWSSYSRFVGDIFGAPLAVEALLAFFLESTFLGLWIFGWDRLPAPLHNACMWLVHLGTLFSAYFILAANSWMQHPVGYEFNPDTGRAEMHDFFGMLTNKVALVTFPHTILAAYMTAGALVLGISLWHVVRQGRTEGDVPMFRDSMRVSAWIVLVAGLGVAISGDFQGKVMTEVQPMKMAAAEALYETEAPASFSILTLGTPDGKTEKFAIKVPRLLSFLATGTWDGEVRGIDDLREEYVEKYGQDPGAAYYDPGDYTPYIPLTYWTFRWMIGLGVLAAAGAALVLWVTRKGREPTGRKWVWLAVAMPLLPLFANSTGWIFTEIGRQPWTAFGLLTTRNSVSPTMSQAQIWTSLITLTLVYAVLAVIEVKLLLHYIRKGPDPYQEPTRFDVDDDRPLAFAY
ncbi:MAG: cytochrome ubiquinol oxidase subunit I [Nocardioidaceae bacterium]